MNVPPSRRAKSAFRSAVRALPTCRSPVGEGAKRTIGGMFGLQRRRAIARLWAGITAGLRAFHSSFWGMGHWPHACVRIFALLRYFKDIRVSEKPRSTAMGTILKNGKSGILAVVAFLALLTGPAYAQSADPKAGLDPDSLYEN